MDGAHDVWLDSKKDGDGVKKKKELLTRGFDRQGEEEGVSKYVEGDLTWCGETFLFTSRFGPGYTQLAAPGPLLLVSHAQQTQPVLSHNAKPSIHVYVQTHTHKNTQSADHPIATRHIFVTIKEQQLLKSMFVTNMLN